MGIPAEVGRHPEWVLSSPRYLERPIAILDHFIGDHPGDEQRRTLQEALFQVSCEKGESLSQHAPRRDRQYQAAEGHGVPTPRLARGVPEQGPGLSALGAQNLRALTARAAEFDKVAQVRKDLDPPPPSAMLWDSMLDASKMKNDSKVALTLADLGPVHKFRWLLSVEQRQSIDAMTKRVWGYVAEAPIQAKRRTIAEKSGAAG